MTSRTLILALALFALGCTDMVDAPDLPYVERMVVYSILTAGEQEVSVSFQRTLPPTEAYSVRKAALADVSAWVDEEGRIHPLHYDSLGVYRASGLMVQAGAVYTLHAQWHGMTCDAQTRVPGPAVIDTMFCSNGPDGWLAQAVVRPRAGEVYGLSWQSSKLSYDPRTSSLGFSTLVRQQDARADGSVSLAEHLFWVDQGTEVSASLQAFDDAFYNYFNSRPGGKSSDEIFSQPGKNQKWNVQGDGIGLFIGRSVVTITVRI